jgi:acetoin utilization deacetylase AcuC-like enzyme
VRTGIVKDARFANHHMEPGHVESPERIVALNRMVDEEVRFPFLAVTPRAATEEEIALIHDPSYVRLIKSTAGRERVALDPDTSTSALTWETALLAAGGCLAATDLILEGKARNGMALVRPPGHHAESNAARGFCIFNNIAIAAEHLIRERGLKRVLIADWDLHHGNGTQHAFYDRADVLFFSTHQYPFYPGSGHWSETGEGPGEGFTFNVPLEPGKTDADYAFIFKRLLGPAAKRFEPEFILVSAGFDIYGGDPLGGMDVSPEGFGALAAILTGLADELCGGRILIVLEGGYNLLGLREGGKAVLEQLAQAAPRPAVKPEISAQARSELSPVIKQMGRYWPLKI